MLMPYSDELMLSFSTDTRAFNKVLLNVQSRSNPITVPRCPESSRKLRFPDYVTMAQDGGKVVRLTHRPLLRPGNTPGTHFC